MEPQSQQESLAFRRLIWISFIIAIVVYGVIGIFFFAPDARQTRIPVWFFPLVAVVLGAGSPLVPRMLGDRQEVLKVDISRWAMAEAVGVVGLVSVVLGGPISGFILYLAAALVLLVLQPPRD